MKEEEIRKAVRNNYGKIALRETTCCGPSTGGGCCSGNNQEAIGKIIGYSEEELSAVPEGANLGLGCGNPTALASLKEGEVVLDLGSGAGFDCFLAAGIVGESGRVIGVDMTAEMLEKARENVNKSGYHNVEFRLGEIENLPVADNSIDVIISNCVINLSPDKKRVFDEAFRVVKPGGRIMVSDIVLHEELPAEIRGSVEAYVGCVAGATTKEEYLATMAYAGFQEIEVLKETSAKGIFSNATAQAIIENMGTSPGLIERAAESIASMQVRARKPV